MLRIANHCHYHKLLAKQLVLAVKDMDLSPNLDLNIDDEGIELCTQLYGQKACYRHSFSDRQLLQRARQKNQSLIRACTARNKTLHTVLDVTAGWGRDSFILATQEKQVTMIEYQALLYHLLTYSLQIESSPATQPIVQRMRLLHDNAASFLDEQDRGTFDIIYLDPMFPAHKSSARPAKELQLLQLLTKNTSIPELFELARAKAGNRVVVKRPLHAPELEDLKPDIVYKEKTIRFDVYLC